MPVQKVESEKREERPTVESVPSDADHHVPEWAEDMEHTLRRLISERQKKRDKDPGLYL